MSNAALEAFSVLEAVLLVAVLGLALLRLRMRLLGIAGGLKLLAEGVTAVEHDLSGIGPAAEAVNEPLRALIEAAPTMTQLAENRQPRWRR
jgi:small neutral amino acid transporter SnatA (MarC family)